MATLLSERGAFTTAGLRLDPAGAEAVTGWTLKPEGMCRDEICVPLPAAMTAGGVDVLAFWRLLGNPVVSEGDTHVLGEGAQDRQSALDGLQAPDFALPDLDGTVHRLSDLRGKKVFLTTWASW